MKTLKYFLSFYKPYKGAMILDLVCASILSLVDIAFPAILSAFTAKAAGISGPALLNWMPWVILGLLVLYGIRTACRFYVACQGHNTGAQMESDMRRDLFDQYMKFSHAYYDQVNTATLSSRMVSDLMDISEMAHHCPENLLIASVKLIGSFVIMFSMNLTLSSILLVITILMAITAWKQNRRMKETFKLNRVKIAGINASLLDSLEGIRVVKAFGSEKQEQKKFRKANREFLDSKFQNNRVMGIYYSSNYFFQGLLYTAVIGAGGYLIATGKMQAAELAAFALYVNVFIGPIDILLEFADSLMKGFTGFRRFEEVMETKPQITEKPDARSLENVKGDIAFDHVSFRYDDDTPVLDQVSFEIPAGGRYALAGPSGSGKSTICSLILRFYDVTGGAVRIDGVDVRDLTLESLRQQIGVVTQDVYLFDGTIADNIRYGKWDATEEEVLEAARKASLAEFIESLPDGLQTRVGEKGTRLSGGQKQRISIARIFLKDPKIVILDEATSALDNESEYYIQQALEKLTENRTSLTIAHRLSTIENADRILVVDGEGISESGTHEELIAQNGLYTSYVFRQFGPHETH